MPRESKSLSISTGQPYLVVSLAESAKLGKSVNSDGEVIEEVLQDKPEYFQGQAGNIESRIHSWLQPLHAALPE